MNDGKKKEVAVQELLDGISKKFFYKRFAFHSLNSMNRLTYLLKEKKQYDNDQSLNYVIGKEITLLRRRLLNLNKILQSPALLKTQKKGPLFLQGSF